MSELGKEALGPPFLVERPEVFPDATLTVHIYKTLDTVEGGMGMMLKKMMPACEVKVGEVMKSTKTTSDKQPAWDEALVFIAPDLSNEMTLSLVNNSGTSQKLGGRDLGDVAYGECWPMSCEGIPISHSGIRQPINSRPLPMTTLELSLQPSIENPEKWRTGEHGP